ncbi:MAG TPA: hypothetical protein VKN73_03740 [Desulfosalsimonadaceae bacterium]|nr:hypothetical protein [Desulfosalsimonadaceae bacterium]
MPQSFYLSDKKLIEIAHQMEERTRDGLKKDGGEILCIPTFVPIRSIPRSGRLIVLDLGGTHIRCAQVELDAGRLKFEKGPVKERLTGRQQRQLDQADFLGRLAGIIQSLGPDPNLPLGYCFSYPAEPTRDGDAVLLRWTKELFVSQTVGHKVGEMLCRHLATEHFAWRCTTVKVINDTVAAMLAGMGAARADAYIGLIVGTGTNMAISLPPHRMPKLSKDREEAFELPVNLESGNFRPPFLTEWDEKLDQASHNPGQQRFEKAVSGQYLANLFKLRLPESRIDARQGAAAVFEKAYGESAETDMEKRMAKAIIDRSTRLVAASLAGIMSFLAAERAQPVEKVVITAEGGVFWAHPAYRETTEYALRHLLNAMGLSGIDFEFLALDHANLLGSAIAGLSE